MMADSLSFSWPVHLAVNIILAVIAMVVMGLLV